MAQNKGENGKLQSVGLEQNSYWNSALEQNSYSIEIQPYTRYENLLGGFWNGFVLNFWLDSKKFTLLTTVQPSWGAGRTPQRKIRYIFKYLWQDSEYLNQVGSRQELLHKADGFKQQLSCLRNTLLLLYSSTVFSLAKANIHYFHRQ